MITKINVTKEQSDWLYSFIKIHNLHDAEQGLQKLIDFYKAWSNLQPTNKSIKEILRLLKKYKCIDEGEFNRIWNDWKNLTKHNSQTIQSAIGSKELIKRRDELRKYPERGIKLKDL